MEKEGRDSTFPDLPTTGLMALALAGARIPSTGLRLEPSNRIKEETVQRIHRLFQTATAERC